MQSTHSIFVYIIFLVIPHVSAGLSTIIWALLSTKQRDVSVSVLTHTQREIYLQILNSNGECVERTWHHVDGQFLQLSYHRIILCILSTGHHPGKPKGILYIYRYMQGRMIWHMTFQYWSHAPPTLFRCLICCNQICFWPSMVAEPHRQTRIGPTDGFRVIPGMLTDASICKASDVLVAVAVVVFGKDLLYPHTHTQLPMKFTSQHCPLVCTRHTHTPVLKNFSSRHNKLNIAYWRISDRHAGMRTLVSRSQRIKPRSYK